MLPKSRSRKHTRCRAPGQLAHRTPRVPERLNHQGLCSPTAALRRRDSGCLPSNRMVTPEAPTNRTTNRKQMSTHQEGGDFMKKIKQNSESRQSSRRKGSGAWVPERQPVMSTLKIKRPVTLPAKWVYSEVGESPFGTSKLRPNAQAGPTSRARDLPLQRTGSSCFV